MFSVKSTEALLANDWSQPVLFERCIVRVGKSPASNDEARRLCASNRSVLFDPVVEVSVTTGDDTGLASGDFMMSVVFAGRTETKEVHIECYIYILLSQKKRYLYYTLGFIGLITIRLLSYVHKKGKIYEREDMLTLHIYI